jgi:sugar lactone lactonase YvrE
MTLLAVFVALTGGLVAWWSQESDPRAGPGWHHEVVETGLRQVDNVVVLDTGEIIVSLEESEGQGAIVALSKGSRRVLLDGLSRADGLALGDGGLFIAEEVRDGRIIRLDLEDLSHQVLAILNRPEGIEWQPDGSLLVAEDRADGRILQITGSGDVLPVHEGLERPEGLTIAPDGGIIVAETGTGRVLRIRDGSAEAILTGLDNPDQVFLAPDGALWITEDATPGRLLRYRDGQLETVLDGLAAPQGIAYDPVGDRFLVAEQGRNRLLAVVTTGN